MKGDEGSIFSKAPDRKPLFLLNPGCPNKEYNVVFKHFHQNIRVYPRSKKKHALTNDWENIAYWEECEQVWFLPKTVWDKYRDLGGVATQENFAIFLIF